VKQNATAIPWAILITFLIFSPQLLGASSSLPIDYLLHTLHGQAPADALSGRYSYVSLDTYNLWSLLTHFLSGQVGKARMYTPVTQILSGQVTYAAASVATFISVAVVIIVGTLRRGGANQAGPYLPFLTAGAMSVVMIITGASPHHLLLVIALLILCRKWLSSAWYYFFLGTLTVTTFVSTYGSFAVGLSIVGYLAPALYSANNSVTDFFMHLYQEDQFITVAATANVIVLVGLTVLAFRPQERSSMIRRFEWVIPPEHVSAEFARFLDCDGSDV
jgi:cell shape-determining protein MreD